MEKKSVYFFAMFLCLLVSGLSQARADSVTEIDDPELSVPGSGVIQCIAETSADMLAAVYPVGSVYISTSAADPAVLFGIGTWERFADGRVLVGAGTSDREFPAGETGGSSTHALTVAEMPSHSHTGRTAPDYGGSPDGGRDTNGNSAYMYWRHGTTSYSVGSSGGGGEHNNLQPYIAVHMWRRIE
jgi:hypothetical protein